MNTLAIFAGFALFLPFYFLVGLFWLRCNPEVVRIIRRTAGSDLVFTISSLVLAILWPVWSIYIGMAYIRGMLRIIREQRAVKHDESRPDAT
ncbi:hypothetical protein AWB81_01836 [Caballeronia arationis]|uniref:hypothetical protein n=1 Tax=Caballeronia arationis TaxID=1777142 RepID=UPI00074B9407|nr:hypothetical protein [Caballeronia arationis]SAK59390.1 hypothetical protein AWB81_01836 [Caballeronia arationis]